MWKTYTGGPAAAPVAGPQSSGAGGGGMAGQWHPTVIYMLLLVLAEILIVAWLSRALLR